MRVTLHEISTSSSAPEPLKRFLTLSTVIDHWDWIISGKRFVRSTRKLRGIDISKLRYSCLDILASQLQSLRFQDSQSPNSRTSRWTDSVALRRKSRLIACKMYAPGRNHHRSSAPKRAAENPERFQVTLALGGLPPWSIIMCRAA
jgi:hypothetical protein